MTGLLYKFYSAHWGRDALYRKRVKISTLDDINDPFEFLATSKKKSLRNAARKWKESAFEDTGVVCFSKTWKEPLMWSHYAESHRGMALGFDFDLPSGVFDVDYSNKRIQMPADYNTNTFQRVAFLNRIRTRKSPNWEHEQEVRIFPCLTNATFENGLFFCPFDGFGQLRQVILGPLYKETNDHKLSETLDRFRVEVLTTRLGFKRFTIERQEKPKLQKVI